MKRIMSSLGAIVLVSAVMVGGPVSPAHASVPSDGTYDCNTGLPSSSEPNFTITSGGVFAGAFCAGAVVIPEGATSIDRFAFSRSTALTSITLPASVTSIGDMAFLSATALTSITIPVNVTSIGADAFSGTISLTSFTVANENPNYSSLDGVLFNYGKTSLIRYPAGKSQTSYVIPASVTSIPGSAFMDATSLTSVTIPANVTSIPGSAFRDATSLTSITIPANVTSVGANAFRGATALTSVYFLGDAPTVEVRAFDPVAVGAKAYRQSEATGFPDLGTVWNNLTVAIVANVVYTVTYDSNGGSAVASGTFLPDGAISQSPTQPTRSGYTFVGWSVTDGGSSVTFPYTPTSNSDLTLYAQWTAAAAPPPASGGGSGGASDSALAQSESGNSLPIDLNPAPVTARGRAALLPEPDRQLKTAPVVIERIQQSSGSSQPAAAVALVGGEEVAVKATTWGSQAASYGVGKVTIDVSVAPNDGVVDSVGGVLSLKIAKNSPASVKGSGFQPNSTMQVFLPATDGSFIALPSVAVAADGSFDGSLTLGTSSRSMPMPIGKRFIQMVGLDEDGNETVLDIPVTVVQPLPAPEINRLNGQRPALTPGQALAFNAGAPETVTLKRSSASTSVEGEDWAFTVAGSTTDETGQTLAFTRDAPVTFSGEGFMPGTRADVWLFSDPTLLGTVDIAADGTFSANFAVDSNFVPTGDHTLQIQGVGDDGFVRAANLGVEVVDPLDSPVAPVGGQRFDLIPLAVMGTALLGLVVLTATVIAVGRRRKPMTSPRPAI